MNPPTILRRRKNLKSLTQPQYRQYFLLLRILKICQPNKAEKISISTPFNSKVIPISLYDMMNSMHNTCCEHGTAFFPYWHRYVFHIFQQFLVRCHDYALSLKSETKIRQEAERLRKISVSNRIQPTPSEQSIQNLLRKTYTSYENILKSYPADVDSKSVIAAHYWNPMDDYQNGIYYPKGLYRVQNNLNQYQYIPQDKYFNDVDQLIKVIYDQVGIYQYNGKTRKTNFQKIEMNTISQNEMNRRLGGKQNSQNYYYPYMNYAQNLQTRPEDFSAKYCVENDSGKFSMQAPHNTYHVNLGSLMSRVPIAGLNFLFWSYHSFIDLALQIKIQWINHNSHPNGVRYENGPEEAVIDVENFLSQQLDRGDIEGLWSQYYSSQNNQVGYKKDYPIFLWVNPSLNSQLTDKDFRLGTKTYSDIIIYNQGSSKRLKELSQSIGSQYDIDYFDFSQKNPFLNNLARLIRISPNPYTGQVQDLTVSSQKSSKQSNFELFTNPKFQLEPEIYLEAVYKSTLTSRFLDITIEDGNFNELNSHHIAIFTRDESASNCPRCQQYKCINIWASPNRVQNKFCDKIDLRKVNKKVVGKTVIYKPAYEVEKHVYWKTNDTNFLIRHKVGRQRVKVRLVGHPKQGKANILAKFISFGHKKVQQETSFAQFNFQSQEVVVQKKDYYISSLEVIEHDSKGETYITKYKFPLYAEYCELEFISRIGGQSNKESSFEIQDLAKEKKIGFAK